jgi:hypothetical protein
MTDPALPVPIRYEDALELASWAVALLAGGGTTFKLNVNRKGVQGVLDRLQMAMSAAEHRAVQEAERDREQV